MLRLKIVLWALLAPFAIALGPLRAFRLYRPRTSSRAGLSEEEILRLVRETDRVLMYKIFNRLIFRTRCLKRSLVLYRLLRVHGCDARAYIGFQQRNSTLLGHAWVKVGELPIPESHPHDYACIPFYEIGDDVQRLSGA